MSPRSLFLILCPLALLLTTHRLPAPISEIPQATPNPKPKREAAPRSKPKLEVTPKPTPSLSFAGAWTGSVVTIGNDGETVTYVYVIKISNDEKTVWIDWNRIGQPLSGTFPQAPSNRFRETLTWNLRVPQWIATCTFRINGNGTASYTEEGTWNEGGGTFKSTGTLSRQDVSSAPSLPQTIVSAPQKTTATSTPQTTGFPTASPVPNKPGFVYNPFDPNKKRILDVRGIPSGTKVTIPASGKQFIVP